MKDDKGKTKLLDGLKIKTSRIMAKELSQNELVSFFNLPTYIEDGMILEKLAGWGVKPISPIRRRMWPGTDIADGTRMLKVRFTDTVKSLPYSTRFITLEGAEYFRVIHDRQVKVCRLCIQPGHILMDCPDFRCYICGGQGHYARQCGRCRGCKARKENCTCHPPEEEAAGPQDGGVEWGGGEEDKDGNEEAEEEMGEQKEDEGAEPLGVRWMKMSLLVMEVGRSAAMVTD